MGYTTNFTGEFLLDKPLAAEHKAYLCLFNETRRMKRDSKKAMNLADPVREAAGLPVGAEGEYFVGGIGSFGQGRDVSVIDGNLPPKTQPGLWNQWRPSDDGTNIAWDGGEKFYKYIEWLEYLITNFLEPWGYKLNGEVEWESESSDDIGKIVVTDNVVEAFEAERVYVRKV